MNCVRSGQSDRGQTNRSPQNNKPSSQPNSQHSKMSKTLLIYKAISAQCARLLHFHFLCPLFFSLSVPPPSSLFPSSLNEITEHTLQQTIVVANIVFLKMRPFKKKEKEKEENDATKKVAPLNYANRVAAAVAVVIRVQCATTRSLRRRTNKYSARFTKDR